MRKHLSLFLLSAALLLLLGSCKLDNVETPPDVDFQSSLDHSFAESEFAAIRMAFDVEAQADSLVRKSSAGIFCPCSEVTVTQTAPLTYEMLIDFGSGCTCLDGRTRAGMLKGVFHGKWSEAGSYVDISPLSYEVTNLQGFVFLFEFEKRITYQGPDNDGHPTWLTVVNDAKLRNQGEKILWTSTYTTRWVEGVGDLDPSNNTYLVTGSATGYNLKVEPFTAKIEEALRLEAGCAHPTSGVLAVTPAGRLTRRIDYGDGTCDNEATFYIGQLNATLKLR